MTRAEANRLLDLVRVGRVQASAETITQALRCTGDIGFGMPRRDPPSIYTPLPGLTSYLAGARALQEAAA
jgi:hypothetical protein